MKRAIAIVLAVAAVSVALSSVGCVSRESNNETANNGNRQQSRNR